MKCLVTGATGFVGSTLVGKLVAEGHNVIALARPQSDTALLKDLGVKIIEGDMAWTPLFARHGTDVDVVFHLAGITRTPRRYEYRTVNQRGTKSLIRGLDRCEFHGRVVYLSSLSAGGPVAGPEAARIEEDSDHPVSEYGQSKRGAERLLREGLTSNASWTILRAGKIYGPKSRKLAMEISRINKMGMLFQYHPQTCIQLTHVEDITDALLRAAFSPEASRKMYYVTERTHWTLPRLAELLAELLGRRVRVVNLPKKPTRAASATSALLHRLFGIGPFAPDPGRLPDLQAGYWLADPTRIENELGWEPHHNASEGLAASIASFRERGWLNGGNHIPDPIEDE